MAPRGKAPRKSSARTGGFGWGGTLLVAVPALVVGLAAGYVWRSYAPLPLPIESQLVADKSSVDVSSHVSLATLAEARREAEQARKERDTLRLKLDGIEAERLKTERALGDLKIKDVLQSRAE